MKADVIVIGGGPGGYVSAIRAAQLGASVILVEKNLLGGTCLNVGCIPTKVLAKTAEVYAGTSKLADMGIRTGQVTLDFAAVQKKRQSVVNNLRNGVSHLLRSKKVKIQQGEAFIKEPGKVEVVDSHGKSELLEAANIIIATGSSPFKIPGLAVDQEQILDSTGALELAEIPSSLLVVGAGVIGMEFASIFAAFGSKVTVVELLPEILPFIDQEVVETLKKELVSRGVEINLTTKVTKVEKMEDGLQVTLSIAGKTRQLKVEKILVAAGRKSNSTIGESLGLVENGVIPVNDKMQTRIKGIYAVGDVTGNYQLAHVAYHEGIVAAENCLGKQKTMSYKAIPQAIFTYPEVSGVGLTEKEAREKHGELKVGVFPFAASGKAMAIGETKGFVKVIASQKHEELLGVFIVGPTATELVQEAVLAINMEGTLEEIAETIHAHPTLTEAVNEAALMALQRPLHF